MKGEILVMRRSMLMVALLAAVLLPATSGATVWCGENGVFQFSFVEGDSLVTVLHTEDPADDVTFVDIYGWLADVDPVTRDGEVFLHVGGFELKLTISGGESYILEQTHPSEVLNIGKELGQVAVGMHPEQRIRDGKVFLVHWKVMFKGPVENVRIGLDRSGLMSCEDIPRCRDNEPLALYVGNAGSRMDGLLVGAGYIPSWINPVGEPDQTPVNGKQTWRDAGIFQDR